MSRQTKLNAEVQRIICEGLRLGMWARSAAARAGVGETTYYRWLSRGEDQPRSIYGAFRVAVKEADAACQVRALATVQRATSDTWQAAAWLLERRHGFVRRDQPEIRVAPRDTDELTAEQFEREARLVAPLLTALASVDE